MKNFPEKVWYASYGSNILEERFLCYICGGTPAGAIKEFKGCPNKNKPEANNPIEIPYELYFAKKSITWDGGGIGFLKPGRNEAEKSLGRMYLISSAQFAELVQQELNTETKVDLDYSKLVSNGMVDCDPKGRYSRIILLGQSQDRPILTFPSEIIWLKK